MVCTVLLEQNLAGRRGDYANLSMPPWVFSSYQLYVVGREDYPGVGDDLGAVEGAFGGGRHGCSGCAGKDACDPVDGCWLPIAMNRGYLRLNLGPCKPHSVTLGTVTPRHSRHLASIRVGCAQVTWVGCSRML